MRSLSLVMPYYMNPKMLGIQYENWKDFDDEIKDKLEIVIVDDGSPESESAINVPRPKNLPKIKIFKVKEDRPWHQHAARNLGARMASGQWLLMTDMDHLFPIPSIINIFAQQNKSRAYLFPRLDAPDLKPTIGRDGLPKPHPNTFCITKEMYWEVGGYDEEFCGVYGTDGLYRLRLFAKAPGVFLPNAPVIRYSREVIGDASTRTLPRKEGREPNAKRDIIARKRAQGRENQIKVLDFPWEQVL